MISDRGRALVGAVRETLGTLVVIASLIFVGLEARSQGRRAPNFNSTRAAMLPAPSPRLEDEDNRTHDHAVAILHI